jgi:hypothetical protein
MTHDRALHSLSMAQSETPAFHTKRLSARQCECLRRCANGISIRFEASELVDALVVGGYVEEGVAGVVTVTARGREYLLTHES